MDKEDRDKILQNLPSLVEGVSFDELFNQLRSKHMFNQYMEREIMSAEESKKLQFLYWYVTTRGPDAFEQLVKALKETNHNDLAALLTRPRPGRKTRIPFINGNASNQPSLDEEFPFDKKWIVVKATEIFEFDCSRVYRMRSLPRGMALIINNRCFVNNVLQERVGSEKDISRLESILDQLGYEVIVEEELTALEIKEKVQDFSKHKKHSECDSAIVIIMSHGQEDVKSKAVNVAGRDYDFVTEREITDLLSAKLCEDLRGKPKMFFFQVCRGNDFNYSIPKSKPREESQRGEDVIINSLLNGSEENGMKKNEINGTDSRNGDSVDNSREQTDGMCVGHTDVSRSDSDILICHATSPGKVSFRNECGSWYIQTLCRVLARDSWKDDLQTMLQTVDRTLEELDYMNLAQTSTFLSTLDKQVYFQPGFH